MILPLSLQKVNNIRGFIRIHTVTTRHSFIAPFGVSFFPYVSPYVISLQQPQIERELKVKTDKNKKTKRVVLSSLSRILRGDYRVNPNIVSWIKLLIAIVLSLLYILNGDIDGLLRLLIGQSLLQGFVWADALKGESWGNPSSVHLGETLQKN